MDGYVWDVMRAREPELIDKTRVVYTSEKRTLVNHLIFDESAILSHPAP